MPPSEWIIIIVIGSNIIGERTQTNATAGDGLTYFEGGRVALPKRLSVYYIPLYILYQHYIIIINKQIIRIFRLTEVQFVIVGDLINFQFFRQF